MITCDVDDYKCNGEFACYYSYSCTTSSPTSSPIVGLCDLNSDQEYCMNCTMSDGTPGKKCDGRDACKGIDDVTTVSCGSCNGKWACFNAAGPIGENSCNYNDACGTQNHSIGVNSCNGFKACNGYANDVITCDVGNNKCNGDKACLYQYSCYTNAPTIAPDACSSVTLCLPTANKVKIQSNTKWPIQVFEVSVMSGGSNVAQGKSATQGSTWNNDVYFSASNAVDGDISTLAHTAMNGDGSDWLEIDLEGSYAIDSFLISNRYCNDISDSSGCLCRLSRATVSLLTDEGEWVDTTLLGDTCGVLTVPHMFTAQARFC